MITKINNHKIEWDFNKLIKIRRLLYWCFNQILSIKMITYNNNT